MKRLLCLLEDGNRAVDIPLIRQLILRKPEVVLNNRLTIAGNSATLLPLDMLAAPWTCWKAGG